MAELSHTSATYAPKRQYEIIELTGSPTDVATYAASIAIAHQEYPNQLGYTTPTPRHAEALLNLRDAATFAARDEDGAVLGAMTMHLVSDDTAVLHNFFRLKAVRGEAIGKELFVRALGRAMAQGAQRVTLEVMSDNRVRDLYEGVGFEAYDPDDDYLDEGSSNNAVVSMELRGEHAIVGAMNVLKGMIRGECSAAESGRLTSML